MPMLDVAVLIIVIFSEYSFFGGGILAWKDLACHAGSSVPCERPSDDD
jgi:hypothetical protein